MATDTGHRTAEQKAAQGDGKGQAVAGDFFVERDGERFAGTHLIVDLLGAHHLTDPDYIERTLRRCVELAGARLLHIHLHHFGEGGGVSGVAVLAESHISIHTWPERAFAAVDVFMCGQTRPEATIAVLQAAFRPSQIKLEELRRGQERDLEALPCR